MVFRMVAAMTRRGKSQKSLDLIAAAARILEEIQPAIVRHLDISAWEHAIDIERAETDSMQEFFASWRQSKSGLGTKYSSEVPRDA